MSSSPVVHVGPYALWRLASAPDLTDELYTLLVDDPIDGRTLAWGWSGGSGELPPETVLDGVTTYQACWHPYVSEREADRAPRLMTFGAYGDVFVPLGEADVSAEITWFARAYKAHLDALAGHYGKAAQLGWGVVAYRS
jgi:hypothetical protein